MNHPLHIGHKGAAGYAPENTLLSIETALTIGVDVIEVDVQSTRDGHLVVIHDWRVEPTTDGEGYVRDLTLAELRRFRTRVGNQPIPTLTEVLDAVTGRAGLMIEIKVPQIASQTVDAVRGGAGFRGSMFYASFLHAELLHVRDADTGAQTIALLDGVPVNQTAFATDARATHAGVAINSLSEGYVRALHEGGFRVFTYTADDPEQIVHARGCNVDGIISNYPDRLG